MIHERPSAPLSAVEEIDGAAALRLVLTALRDDPNARTEIAALVSNAPPPRTFYTTKTLALELGTDERTVRRAIASGELQASRRVGKWVMTTEDVRAWVNSGRQATPPGRGDRPQARRGVMAKALRGNS